MKKTTIFALAYAIAFLWLYSCLLFYQMGRAAGAREIQAIHTTTVIQDSD